ncbi:MAG: cell surface protein [Rikenellaceae bacterium]|nr:cell surface protein [Rikenellaceae bacterium]
MSKILRLIFILSLVVVSSSCDIDEDITTTLPPKIILDNETGIYTVKQGRELVIAPDYEFAEGATYSWTMNGEVLGSSPSLKFMQEEVGKYFVTIAVSNEGGVSKEEIRVDVVELEIPTVSIAGDKKLMVAAGTEVKLNATIRETSLATKFSWSINGSKVCEELSHTFKADVIGNHTIIATATNDDGSHSDTVNIEVLDAKDMPFVWQFDRTVYHNVVGRKLLIKPTNVSDDKNVEYTWTIAGQNLPAGNQSHFIFTANNTGEYQISATATTLKGENRITISHSFTVTIHEENKYYRAKNSSSSADWNKVYEYTPAPGQFINELKTGGFDGSQTTMESAIAYAEGRLNSANWVSLGGFGGYIVIGFDHSIDNSGGYDLGVIGNAFDGSSEPGVIWVMQDENGNGLPDDTWYELVGSESDKSETIRNYAVTYYRPTGAGMPVQWTDNMDNRGKIDYLSQFHTQDYYYPLWIEKDSYTLVGTRLEARNYDKSGNGSYWVQPSYDWGYADNFSSSDFKSSDKANLFKISNAVDFEGKKVNLTHIDFVKVQCAVNAKSGWLGELSTEVCGFYDCSLKNNK